MDNVSLALDAAQMAQVIKDAVKEFAGPAVAEAIKPFTERTEKFKEIAENLVELERKKAQLNPEQKSVGFARFVRAIALGKGSIDRSVFEATKHWGSDDYVVKALTASNISGAGGLIPQAYAAEFIDLLRGRTVIRKLARVLPMPNGNLTIRKGLTAGTASYVGESAAVTASQQTIGDINFSFKKLVALTPVSNSLLRMASPAADAFVRDDLLQVMGLREDAAFITGDGTSNTPIGLFSLIAAANQFADTGTTFLQQIADYTKAIRLVEEANVPVDDTTGKWILAPRVFWGIYKTQGAAAGESTSPFMLGLQGSPPRLIGYEVLRSTQAKKVANEGTDLTATTDRIYFVHTSSMLLADSLDLQVTSFDGAAYVDSTSTLVSGVSRDESVIRVISEHDFALQYDLAGSIITGVSVGN